MVHNRFGHVIDDDQAAVGRCHRLAEPPALRTCVGMYGMYVCMYICMMLLCVCSMVDDNRIADLTHGIICQLGIHVDVCVCRRIQKEHSIMSRYSPSSPLKEFRSARYGHRFGHQGFPQFRINGCVNRHEIIVAATHGLHVHKYTHMSVCIHCHSWPAHVSRSSMSAYVICLHMYKIGM